MNAGELPWMTMENVHRLALETPLAHYGVTGLTDDEIDRSRAGALASSPLARFGRPA